MTEQVQTFQIKFDHYAHFYRAPRVGKSAARYEISITPTAQLKDAVYIAAVAGKREARKIAAQHNAICWNF